MSNYQEINDLIWVTPEGGPFTVKEYLMADMQYAAPSRSYAPPPQIQAPKARVTLDPNDPFEEVLISIVETNRRKRKDYALDDDPFSNFKMTSDLLGIPGFGPTEAALFNVIQKLIRLHSLRKNGRIHDTANESVIDTYLDAAVYTVITYAIAMQRQDQDRASCED
jgi:hypothetical protein